MNVIFAFLLSALYGLLYAVAALLLLGPLGYVVFQTLIVDLPAASAAIVTGALLLVVGAGLNGVIDYVTDLEEFNDDEG